MVESIYFLKPAWCGTHRAGLWPEQDFQSVTVATAFRRWFSLPGLESKRVADADEVIHGRPRQAYPEMEINLVERTQLVSHTEVQQVPGPSTLGKIARVLDECIA